MNSDNLIFTVQWILMVQNKNPHHRLFFLAVSEWSGSKLFSYCRPRTASSVLWGAQALGKSGMVLAFCICVYK